MTCTRCVTLEAERDQFAQAVATMDEEGQKTEAQLARVTRERDDCREAVTALTRRFKELKEEGDSLRQELRRIADRCADGVVTLEQIERMARNGREAARAVLNLRVPDADDALDYQRGLREGIERAAAILDERADLLRRRDYYAEDVSRAGEAQALADQIRALLPREDAP